MPKMNMMHRMNEELWVCSADVPLYEMHRMYEKDA
jgi:hypothetical protein